VFGVNHNINNATSVPVISGEPEKKTAVVEAETKKKEPKKAKEILINMKRAQNAGIALARFKLSFEQIKVK